jgi:hypothetical protein
MITEAFPSVASPELSFLQINASVLSVLNPGKRAHERAKEFLRETIIA